MEALNEKTKRRGDQGKNAYWEEEKTKFIGKNCCSSAFRKDERQILVIKYG